MVSAILAGHLKPGEKLPSTRHLSRQLGISRNTTVLVYQGLTDDGYLRTAQRSGYFVNETVLEMGVYNFPGEQQALPLAEPGLNPVDWASRTIKQPTLQRNIEKPRDWQSLEYPFIYGQPDPDLLPVADWRDCVYQAMGKKWLDEWSQDGLDSDDPMLVEQIRSRILPRRGILVGEDQILVTMGAQQALYAIASLLIGPQTNVVVEEPGYPDARNIFELKTSNVRFVQVDDDGLPVSEIPDAADIIYTTPSHQLPTTATMPDARRRALIAHASRQGALIIEDDYELEINHAGKPLPALKSLDREGRVIYVGSFSKTLFPGLRLGFVVASPELITELRALRRLMVRHPPINNQRSTAFFLSLGYYDVFVRRLHRTYRERWQIMSESLSRHFGFAQSVQGMGGSSFWIRLGKDVGIDTSELANRALEDGILIEPGEIYFGAGSNSQCFRLGYSSIAGQKIEPGLKKLSRIVSQLMG